MRTDQRLLELETALDSIKWDVIGLGEVRRMGEQIEEYDNYIFYYKGETKGLYGVGFLIKKHLKKYIVEFNGVSERIAMLRIKLPGYKYDWTIIQVYAPTEAADDTTKDDFYELLSKTLENTSKHVIVMGDFNGRIGKQRQGEEAIIGKYGSSIRTENGKRMVNMALENNLKFMNSCFKKKESRRWTWTRGDGKYRNEIDYIASNSPKAFQNIEVINQFNFSSNHRMVRAVLSPKNPKKPRNLFNNSQQKPAILSKNENVPNQSLNYVQTLYNREIEEMYGTIKATKKMKKEILSTKTKELIEQRRNLLLHKKDDTIMKKIASVSKEISNRIKQDKTRAKIDCINFHVARTGGVKKALKELQECRTWIPKMKKSNNKEETKRKSILEIATSFYKNLYSYQVAQQEEILNSEIDNEDTIPPILKHEVENAVFTQKNNKAPGPDGILNETMKLILPETITRLTALYNNILYSEYIPTQWTTSTITLIHKKGNRDDINNYRPISLMSNIYKVFSKIILNRITKKLDEQQPKEQAGFRSGYCTIDHIHVLQQMIEKCQEYGLCLYLGFVDYNKAFDSIHHTKIWKALERQGVEHKYIRIIKNIYTNSSAQVKMETLGEIFPIERGVRQGDPLSPKLFSAVLEEIFREMDWSKFGISINGSYLNHLRFADDLVLFTDNAETLQVMLQDLTTKSKKAGLTLSKTKTKVMTNQAKNVIMVDGEPIEYVESYVYLGQIVSFSDHMEAEIEKRITNAWNRFWSLKDIMKGKQHPNAIKRKIFNTCILPIMTYGCQTWATTQKTFQKLITCQRGIERSMLGYTLRHKKRAVDIRKITKVEDVSRKTKTLKWRWTGHMMRDQKQKWSTTITGWTPRYKAKRKRGRQRKRWSDDLKQAGGPLWTRLAKDRKIWRDLEEAYVSQGHAENEDPD